MSKRRVTCLGTAASLFLLCACSAASAQLFTPQQMIGRAHAYEGAARPASQIATVFIAPKDGMFAYICTVNGKNYFKLTLTSGPCGYVVYLLPSTHQLGLRYAYGASKASPTIAIRVEAGKTYQLVGTRVKGEAGGRDRAMTSINPMPPGFALTYKHIYPEYYAGTNRPNARINPDDTK